MVPTRIVLSRRAGFDLQAQSQALNGLPAQSVARPGRWGNPFAIADIAEKLGIDPAAAQAEAVSRFERWIAGELAGNRTPPALAEIQAALANKNLACWCRDGTPCHADILLRLANE